MLIINFLVYNLYRYIFFLKMELLRKKLIHWRNQVRRMSDYKYGMASLIQRTWRDFHERNEMKKNLGLPVFYRIDKFIHFNDFTTEVIYKIVEYPDSEG